MTNVRSTARTILRTLADGIVLANVFVAAFALVAPARAATDQNTWTAQWMNTTSARVPSAAST